MCEGCDKTGAFLRVMQPLEIHMLTYDGKAFLNVLVAADIIHDPELLCLCFQEALRDMKSKVMNAEKYDGKILFRSA